ncbi:MAG TPA: MFS transporter [Dehalococcoidia bacterium]
MRSLGLPSVDSLMVGRRVYYGWSIVFGLAAVAMVANAMGGVNFGLFIRPMREDLGVGDSAFGWAQTARLIGSGVSGWFLGRLLDRHGARLPLAVAGAGTAVVMVGLAWLTQGWQMVALFFVSGFFGLQGGGSLYNTVTLARWFVRKRGKAMSIAAMGLPVGIFIFSPVTQLLIDGVGWRTTWLVLASGGGVIFLVALLIIRRQPQDMGLLPDGDGEDPAEPGSLSADGRQWTAVAEHAWTRDEAIRSAAFWRLSAAEGLMMLSMSSLSLFRIPFFQEQGVDPQIVAFALSVEAAASLCGGIPAGWAVDRFPPRFAAALAAALMVLSFLATMAVSADWHVFIAMMLFGIAAMAMAVTLGVIWPAYFGSENIGGIRGFSMPFILVLSGLGPPLTGMVRDASGTYMPAWIGGAIAMTICTLLFLTARKPEPRATRAGHSALDC